MKTSRIFIAALSLLAASSMVMAAHGSGPGADSSQEIDISGPVVAFTGGSGSGLPMLTVDDAVLGSVDVALGPVWFIQDSGFTAAEGESVVLLAYACTSCAAAYVAAWVENTSNGSFINLRNEDGRPLWTQRQRRGSGRPDQGNGSGGQGGGSGNGEPGGSGNGNGEPGGSGGQGGGSGNGEPGGSGNGNGSGPANGSGLDMALIETVTGIVVDFTGHPGSGQPVLTLDVDGEIYEITVSPYAPIEAAGFVIEPGMTLTVVFVPTECEEDPHLVTISIQDDATGVVIQLRDSETGFPMTTGGGQNRPNWP